MASENKNFTSILNRFPYQQDLIIKQYENNDFFRSLCDDYLNVQEFQKTTCFLKMAAERQREYEILLYELERELKGNITSLSNQA